MKLTKGTKIPIIPKQYRNYTMLSSLDFIEIETEDIKLIAYLKSKGYK